MNSKISIKYNPYIPQMDIVIDGKEIKRTSKLYKYKNEDIQTWIHNFANLLIDEINDDKFDIEFEGREEEFKELENIFREYSDIKIYNTINIELSSNKNRIDELADLFKEIQRSGLIELNTDDMKEKFERVLSLELKIGIIDNEAAKPDIFTNRIQEVYSTFKSIVKESNIEEKITKNIKNNRMQLSRSSLTKRVLKNKINNIEKQIEGKNLESLKLKIDNIFIDPISETEYVRYKVEDFIMETMEWRRNKAKYIYEESFRYDNGGIPIEYTKKILEELSELVKTIQRDIKIDIQNIIKKNIEQIEIELFKEYKENIIGLIEVSQDRKNSLLNLNFIDYSIDKDYRVIDNYLYEKEVEEYKFIENDKTMRFRNRLSRNKDHLYREKQYVNKIFVEIDDLIDDFISSVNINLFENIEKVNYYIYERINQIKFHFNQKIEEFNKVLIEKKELIENVTRDKEKLEQDILIRKEIIKELKSKEEWLVNINKKLENIVKL